MERVLEQVRELSAKHQDCPVLCAGDVFDRWNAPAELINWALEHLPTLYGIPGNHDLPSHRPELVHRSAYGTLVHAGKVKPVGVRPTYVGPLALYGRPFGGRVPRLQARNDLCLHVLLTHEYLWVPGACYHGAPHEAQLSKATWRAFADFDTVVVGDNHMGWQRERGGTTIVNCGTLLRRKSSEVTYRPSVGMLHQNGKVVQHPLDVGKDVLLRTVTEEQEALHENSEIANFVEGLASLDNEPLNFREAMIATMKKRKVEVSVRDIVLGAMEAVE